MKHTYGLGLLSEIMFSWNIHYFINEILEDVPN